MRFILLQLHRRGGGSPAPPKKKNTSQTLGRTGREAGACEGVRGFTLEIGAQVHLLRGIMYACLYLASRSA